MTKIVNAKAVALTVVVFFVVLTAALVLASADRGHAQSASDAPSPASDQAQWKSGDDCVNYKDEKDIDTELRREKHSMRPRLLGTAWFLAADAATGIVLTKKFDDTATYFGAIERRDSRVPPIRLGRIGAEKISEKNPLVTDGLATRDDTLLTVRVPKSAGGLWDEATLYIYACAAPGSPAWVSRWDVRVSSPFYSSAFVWAAIAFLFLLAAAATRGGNTKGDWFRSLNPVRIVAGADGKASLSKLQILFFSLIIFGLVTFIFLRTGVLSDLSETILYLLGIAGVGTVAAQGADDSRNRVTPENEAWLVRKGMLPDGGLAAKNKPSWRDLITSNGEFDVFRYQNLIFSLTIGAALIARGVTELASFTVPFSLLSLLGLSQAIYVGGKVVGFAPASELNATVEELRKKESGSPPHPEDSPAASPDAEAAEQAGETPPAPPSAEAALATKKDAVRSLLDKLTSGHKK